MKLLNVGEREFVTPWGRWQPMDVLEVPKDKADFYLGYAGEVRVLEEVVEEVATKKPAEVVKKQKKGK